MKKIDWKLKTFSLDKDSIKLLRNKAIQMKMNDSCALRIMIKEYPINTES